MVAAEACSLSLWWLTSAKMRRQKILRSALRLPSQASLELGDQDALAFESVMKAFRGDGDRVSACEQAAGIPAEVIRICLTHVEDLEYLASKGNANLITDTAIASLLFDSAMKSSELNILINMKDFDDYSRGLSQSVINDVPGATGRLQFIASTIRTGLS